MKRSVRRRYRSEGRLTVGGPLQVRQRGEAISTVAARGPRARMESRSVVRPGTLTAYFTLPAIDLTNPTSVHRCSSLSASSHAGMMFMPLMRPLVMVS